MDVDFYTDRRGRSPVQTYIREAVAAGEKSLPAQLERMVDLLEQHGVELGPPLSDLIDKKARIYELRPGNHRIACRSTTAESCSCTRGGSGRRSWTSSRLPPQSDELTTGG